MWVVVCGAVGGVGRVLFLVSGVRVCLFLFPGVRVVVGVPRRVAVRVRAVLPCVFVRACFVLLCALGGCVFVLVCGVPRSRGCVGVCCFGAFRICFLFSACAPSAPCVPRLLDALTYRTAAASSARHIDKSGDLLTALPGHREGCPVVPHPFPLREIAV